MSDLPILSEEKFKEQFPDIHQQVCEELGMGFVPTIFRCVVVLKKDLAMSSWNMVRKNLCSGDLPRITKELMFSYIANKKECSYCMIAHHALALHHGFTGDDMSTILNDIEQIKNPTLKLVIKLADASVDNNFELVASVDKELCDLGFARDEITELIGMICCALYMVNLANSIGVGIDQEFINTISVDSNFIRDLKSIYQKTRFSVDIDTCVLFRFVNGLWWEVMPVIESHKFIDNCRWTKVPKNQVSSIESLFEIRDEVVSHKESMGSNSDIFHLLSQGNVHFERFKTEHGGVAFKPSDSKVFSQYDSAFLANIAAIISFCIDKDISSHYLQDVYDSLQSIADKLNDDNQDEHTLSAILLDPVTGLHNKLGFLRVIQFLVDKKQSNSFVIVLSLEMSGGSINLLDEEVKSVFLKMAIVRLKAIIPDNKTLSILNSSEFAFIMIDSTQEEVIQILSDVMDSFLNYLLVDGHPMACELRAGYSCYPSCESEPNELLRMAYIALYQAKNTPSRRAVGYQDEIVQELRLHLELAHCLPRAIEAQEFILYFQPIVKTTKLDEEIHHYEALIRWKHPIKGMIPPDRFIEIAEKSGDIIAIGYWVIHEVCRCLSLPTVPDDVGVSINLSPVQFKEERLVQNITSIVNEYGISPKRITIEITETSAMQDNELTKDKFSEFHEEGFKLSMDDFGTGYSSLSYLLNFHFDIIKIDKSFIDNTLVDIQYEIIAQAVVKLAHDLSLVVVCEGIETDEQFKMVSEWKTDMIQGYLISKPKPWNEFYSN